MSEISASAIKDLRETTGAGMMDCKKALVETSGNVEAAVEWLRKKGLAAASKKSGRVAAQGLVAGVVSGTKGAVIELNSETDFVARNDTFQALAASVAAQALVEGSGDVEKIKASKLANGQTVAESIAEHVGVIGENMQLRRASVLSVSQGVVAAYIHNSVVPGMGKIGVLVALESTGDASKLEPIAKQIAMHVAAARPESLVREELSPALIEKERSIAWEQSKTSGKPDNIVEKMVEGRMQKFYGEVVLLEQLFVVDGKSRVKEVIAEAAKTAGAPVTLKGFIRLELGEGIEKEETDFAAEVAAVARG